MWESVKELKVKGIVGSDICLIAKWESVKELKDAIIVIEE